MKYTKLIKPGTNKSQLVESDKVEFYKQYGWELETVKVSKSKKTAQPKPAVEEVDSSVEVVGDDIQGE